MTAAEVRRILRGLEPDDHHLEAPPISVWDRIADEVGIGSPGPLSEAMEALDDDTSVPPVVGLPPVADDVDETEAADTRNGPRLDAVLGIAAALVVIAAVAVTSLLGMLQDPILAEVDLTAFDERASDTSATVVSAGEGRELHVMADLPETDGYYEGLADR